MVPGLYNFYTLDLLTDLQTGFFCFVFKLKIFVVTLHWRVTNIRPFPLLDINLQHTMLGTGLYYLFQLNRMHAEAITFRD